jgi:hypothetical protein
MKPELKLKPEVTPQIAISLYDEAGNPTNELLNFLAEATGGKAWTKREPANRYLGYVTVPNAGEILKSRIYFNEGRLADVYLDFDGGWSLKVYLKPCNQTNAWYSSQKKKLMQDYQEALELAIGSFHYGEPVTSYSAETNEAFEIMVSKFTALLQGGN